MVDGRGAASVGRPAALIIAVCCALWLCGCLSSGRTEVKGVTVSRVTATSREYLPSQGGQTILVPRRMADVTALWKPLSPEELKKRAAYTALPGHGAPLPSGLDGWLPESERGVMQSYLYRLTVTHAGVTRRALQRADRYLPMIRSALAQRGLPPELAALPLVESAFEPEAVSRAGAAGLWQLMPATARRFGLVVDGERDQRFDPELATGAAADYLAWLYGCFRDWPLALAAYNCGEGAMARSLGACGADTLSGLTVMCRSGTAGGGALPEETLRFVPQFVAAAAVMSHGMEAGAGPVAGPASAGAPPPAPPGRKES